MSKRLYVGNLPYAMDEAELRTIFGRYGAITDATVVKDRESGRSKGFGFVEFANGSDGERAIQGVNGSDCSGRTLRVNEARQREGGGRGRHGGGRRGNGRGGGRY